ncbi:MAG: hypothetical protein ABJA67_13475 [Chthonomonadales bacterium]
MALNYNMCGVAFAQSTTTASPSPVEKTNETARGAVAYINISAIDAGVTLTVSIEAKDPASSAWVNILTSAALSAVAMTTLKVCPGLPVSANVSANDGLPLNWRIKPIQGGSAGNITYSIGYAYLD